MPSSGPPNAEICIIGDFPDSAAVNKVSAILSRYGVTGCFFTTISEVIPTHGELEDYPWVSDRKTCPGEGWAFIKGKWFEPEFAKGIAALEARLAEVSPRIVVCLGKGAFAAFTGQTAIGKWRGSRVCPPDYPFTVVPVQHPRGLIKQPHEQFILEMDLKRVQRIYSYEQLPRQYNFTIAPTFDSVVNCLVGLLERAEKGPLKLSGDLETRAGYIACFGIAWSPIDAICIPSLIIPPPEIFDGSKLDKKTGLGILDPKLDQGLLAETIGNHLWHIQRHPDPCFYWNPEDEAYIVSLLAQLFHHPNIIWIGQNYLYDCQYFWWHWGFLPARVRDTMVGHHSLHSNIRKGLDFLSSMYADDHVYWKDEIKEWDPHIGERQYWTYNCKDACITWEIDSEILDAAESRGVMEHFNFQQSLFFPVLRMMNRGIRLDTKQRGEWNHLTETGTGLKGELVLATRARQEKLNWLVGHELNPGSSTQLINFFYKDLGIPGIKALATESLTTNSPAMAEIADKEPLLKPLCLLIVELRSLRVFQNTFIDASLDSDGRMRCSFSIAGPTTYRFSSSENAFGSGMNLQNIPVAEKQKIKDKDYIKLPNIRKLFIPDVGFIFFDMDLDRADMQVVGWESGDRNLKLALQKGIDLHCMSAAEIFGVKGIPVDELTETHPNYPEHRAKIGKPNRDKTKNGGHACDYGVGDRKLAQTLGISVHEASLFKAKWFGLYPGIRKWHLRVEKDLATKGYIENKFGARLYQFGRANLPEFLGWVPQSTVAGVINRALVNIDAAEQAGETSIQLLIQVHDSLAGQFRAERCDEEIARLRDKARIVVPYDDPLIIPVGIKTSEVSWGDCK